MPARPAKEIQEDIVNQIKSVTDVNDFTNAELLDFARIVANVHNRHQLPKFQDTDTFKRYAILLSAYLNGYTVNFGRQLLGRLRGNLPDTSKLVPGQGYVLVTQDIPISREERNASRASRQAAAQTAPAVVKTAGKRRAGAGPSAGDARYGDRVVARTSGPRVPRSATQARGSSGAPSAALTPAALTSALTTALDRHADKQQRSGRTSSRNSNASGASGASSSGNRPAAGPTLNLRFTGGNNSPRYSYAVAVTGDEAIIGSAGSMAGRATDAARRDAIVTDRKSVV